MVVMLARNSGQDSYQLVPWQWSTETHTIAMVPSSLLSPLLGSLTLALGLLQFVYLDQCRVTSVI